MLIKVAATAVNRADVMQRQGNYPPPRGASPYLGLECSGTVAALGESVAGWEIGDEVCALLAGGGYAEYVAVPVGQLMHVPQGVSLVDAAALPEVSCTVWSMVFGAEAGRLQPGERLLVHGGTQRHRDDGHPTRRRPRRARVHDRRNRPEGGVLPLARGGRRDQLPRGGLRGPHRRGDRERSGRPGRRCRPRQHGGAYLPRNIEALALGGRLIVLGLQGGRRGELDLGALLTKRATVHAAGLRARPAAQKATVVAETVLAVWPLVEAGTVRPIIDRVLSLDDVVEAHRRVESSEHIGKVLLRVD